MGIKKKIKKKAKIYKSPNLPIYISMNTQSLKSVFSSFSPSGYMDNREFMKLCKDSKLISKKVTTSEIDITFSRVKGLGSRRISYDDFLVAINSFAKLEGQALNSYYQKIQNSEGPKMNGTKGWSTRLHDDRSTWTGVYAKGGPTNVDFGTGGKVNDINMLCNRKEADVRGRLVR